MKKERVTIFEELAARDRLAVMLFLRRGDTVCFLRLNNPSPVRWIDTLVGSKKIERLDVKYEMNTFDSMYYDKAFDNVDKFFLLMAETSTMKRMRKLCGDDSVDLAFKKELTKKLARLYYINFIVDRLKSAYHGKDVRFIPSDGIPPYRTDGCEGYDYKRFYSEARRSGADIFETGTDIFPVMLIPGMYAKAALRRVKAISKTLSLCAYIIIHQLVSLPGARKRHRRQYEYGVMVIAPIRQFANRIQKVDFLVDGKLIKKSNTLFIAYRKMNKACRSYLAGNDLSFIDRLDSFFSPRRTWRAVLEYAILFSRLPDAFTMDISASIIHYHLRWSGFTQFFGIEALVTHCDFAVQSIVRNIVLGKHGCRTFHYMDSTNLGGFLRKAGSPIEHRHSNFGFLYYDHLLAWNDLAIDYFKRSHCEIKNYTNVGCLWAEHLALIRSGQITSAFGDKLREHGFREGMKVIAVFDSSFHDNSLTTCSDGIEFLKGIHRLLDDRPDLFVVIKEKLANHIQTDSRQQDLTAAYAWVKSHVRCYAADKKDNPSEVIAFSDIAISFPFTSTSFEALSAGKRALWYDAAGKFKNTFLDSIPGLVCHNYQEMRDRVIELLFKMDDGEYGRYLDGQVKGRVENYLDCQAITRMRKFLCHALESRAVESQSPSQDAIAGADYV